MLVAMTTKKEKGNGHMHILWQQYMYSLQVFVCNMAALYCHYLGATKCKNTVYILMGEGCANVSGLTIIYERSHSYNADH